MVGFINNFREYFLSSDGCGLLVCNTAIELLVFEPILVLNDLENQGNQFEPEHLQYNCIESWIVIHFIFPCNSVTFLTVFDGFEDLNVAVGINLLPSHEPFQTIFCFMVLIRSNVACSSIITCIGTEARTSQYLAEMLVVFIDNRAL